MNHAFGKIELSYQGGRPQTSSTKLSLNLVLGKIYSYIVLNTLILAEV